MRAQGRFPGDCEAREMENLVDRIADYGVLGAVLAFMLWVGYAKILPLWKDTVIALQKAIETLDEVWKWAKDKNGKRD